MFDPLLTQALASGDSMVIFFSVLIAIGVEVMRQSGGTQALVAFFLRFTKTRKKSMFTMWFAGLTVFLMTMPTVLSWALLCDQWQTKLVSLEKISISWSTPQPLLLLPRTDLHMDRL